MRNELTLLRRLLRLAHRKWGYLDRVLDIELPKAPRGENTVSHRKRDRETAQRLRAIQQPTPRSHCHPGDHTGMRKNEIMGLTWERVELDKDLGFNARSTLCDAKNGEPRGVPLNTGSRRPSGAYSSGTAGRSGGKSALSLRRQSSGPEEVFGHKSFSMTLRYAHPSPMHLRTAVESLAGLTPESSQESWTHRRTHSVEFGPESDVTTSQVLKSKSTRP